MAFQHQLQSNRFELKYIIHEQTALNVRNFARAYLEPDEYADPSNNYSYPIHSLYVDSPGLTLFNATLQGHKNRFKLRIRYYDDFPDNPVFFEIKRRVNDVIMKKRAAVKRSSVHRLLGGHWPEMSDMIKENDVKGYDALCIFCDLMTQMNGTGKVIVSYIREAWVTPLNNSVRLTFDRNLIATRWDGGDLITPDFKTGLSAQPPGVILELKFTDRFPVWMRDLVRTLNLQRTSMPKYVDCLRALNPREIDPERHMGAMV